MDAKKELRRRFSAIRKAAQSPVKDELITARMMSADRLLAADTVLLYASFGSEVNTWELADMLIKKGISVAFPRCGEDSSMTFHVVGSLAGLMDAPCGKYGICEPDMELPQPVITHRTVCVIPGLAFTEKGGRLGYGGGYYDRFLAENSGIFTIAPAYEAVIADELPAEEHDIQINAIVTEERLVLCNE